MELEIEIRVIDPVAVVEVERHLHQAPSKRRHPGKTLCDQPLDIEDRQLSAGRGRPIEDRQTPHVSVMPRVFEGQELLVERG